jgi:hypothetical protein
LDDVYRKFGEASEVAQLLETELGNVLIENHIVDENLLEYRDPERVSEILRSVNRNTLGRLLGQMGRSTESLDHFEELLSKALVERNRLAHSFYRQHNFRRNSDEGRMLMMKDLELIHSTLLEAYRAVLLLSGIDLDSANVDWAPTKHLSI